MSQDRRQDIQPCWHIDRLRDGGILVECPKYGSDKVSAPFRNRPDREEQLGWTTLQCNMCGHRWRQPLRKQEGERKMLLEWKDGRPRFKEAR